MEHPGISIFEGSEGLQLDTSLQHLEEDEAEEDQKRMNYEVLQPVPCTVCVRHIAFSADQQFIQFTAILCYVYIACLVYIFIVTWIEFCVC
jgi:hypothetical protein